jgi:hypothetical protein
MRRWNGRGLARSFGDDESEEAQAGIDAENPAVGEAETAEADYSFEGYSVEFIDKVVFLPLAVAGAAIRRAGR